MRYASRVRPTRPPDDARRARHETSGAWPQPPLSTLLADRAARTPDRVFVIEGRREGGRSFTFADVAARADRMAVALQRLGGTLAEAVEDHRRVGHFARGERPFDPRHLGT